jgi:hypothetical protein
MELVEGAEQASSQSTSAGHASLAESSPRDRASTPLVPQQAIEPCPTCVAPAANGGLPPSFVYAIGEIDWLPSSESLDQEISQVLVTRKEELKGLGLFEAQRKFFPSRKTVTSSVSFVGCYVSKRCRLTFCSRVTLPIIRCW